MKTRQIITAGVGVLLAVSVTGCAKRQISVEETGSSTVPGTTWQRFCDGPNAVIWIPGRNGEEDDLEAYVYEHWQCAPEFYAEVGAEQPGLTGDDPARGDADGILEDEEE